MALELSVCGLYVIPGREVQGWEGGNYWQEVVDLDLSVALGFTRQRVHEESLGNGLSGTSFIAAASHPGHVIRCEGIDYADQPVNPEEEYQHFSNDMKRFTVCGFYADTFQTYSAWTEAISPRMAYLTEFDRVQQTEGGRYLYVACVHPDHISRLAMPGSLEPPAFGDPLVTTPEQMGEELDSILGLR